MKCGDLVRVVKNDMALVISRDGFKDNKFFNKIGTIIKSWDKSKWQGIPYSWYEVMFSSGIYSVREDAITEVK